MPIARHYKVIVCGAGPTGLMLANLLGGYDVDTLVVDRKAATVQEPRAALIGDEALRTMQSAGLIDALLPTTLLDCGLHFDSAAGQQLAAVDGGSRTFGFPRQNGFRQTVLEAVLIRGFDRFPPLHLKFGYELTAVSPDQDRVRVTLRRQDGRDVTATCDYLAACDGGDSFVRTALGIPFNAAHFRQRWIVVDLEGTRDRNRTVRVTASAKRAMWSIPIHNGNRRYAFKLRARESDETAESEEFCRTLLHACGPDGGQPLLHRKVYTGQSGMAAQRRAGRTFLLGDAACLAPPFVGQGMNNGIRDAHNLAWKLAAVIENVLPASLLDSYERERGPHAAAFLERSRVLAHLAAPRMAVSAWMDRIGMKLPALVPGGRRKLNHVRNEPQPVYTQGFLAAPEDESVGAAIGSMFPQPLVETASGSRFPLDGKLGGGFCMVAYSADPDRALSCFEGLPPDLNRICITPTSVLPHFAGRLLVVRDVDSYLDAFVKGERDIVFIIRPDRYVADAVKMKLNGHMAARWDRLMGRTAGT